MDFDWKLPNSFSRQADYLLEQDLSLLDLSSHWLQIASHKACLEYTLRSSGVISGLETLERLIKMLGLDCDFAVQDGQKLEPHTLVLRAKGQAKACHEIWKTGLNLLEFCSGVASRTRLLVDKAQAVNPRCGVFTTRKMIPGSKPWAIQAVLDGGGFPHRLGLSETVLIFDQHKNFFPSRAALIAFIQEHKYQVKEKKVLVEVASLEEALAFAKGGADGLQFDKVPATDLKTWVDQLRQGGFDGALIAAGGVKDDNIEAYAASGVDCVATSWVYHGPTLDLGAKIYPL